MSDAREDLFAVAALLAELDRVLHPLERGEHGDFKVDPPLPPSLPTPGAKRREGEAGRAVKAALPTSGPRPMAVMEPHDVPPVNRPPVQEEVPTVTSPPAPIRRRVPRPEGTSASPQEARLTVESAPRLHNVMRRNALDVPVIVGTPLTHEAVEEPRPSPPRIELRIAPPEDRHYAAPARHEAPAVPPTVEAHGEIPSPRRTRVPRPSSERSSERPRIRARVPESPTRRHRVARAVAQTPPATSLEPGNTPAPVSPRTRPSLVRGRPQAPETRQTPPFQEELESRPRGRPVQIEERTIHAPQSKVRGESTARPTSRGSGQAAPGPVHIEVTTLLPPPRVEALPPHEETEVEPLWAEEAPEYEAAARPFFMNGRRVTARDPEALQQAEQRLRRRMTGRSLWRRRG